MKCPKCGADMDFGKAIDPGYRDGSIYIAPIRRILNTHEIRLIDCFKCPKCGHSDDGK